MDKTYGDDYNKGFDTYEKVSAAVSLGGLFLGGVGKGIAKLNQKKAKEIYSSAQDRYMSSFRTFEDSTKRAKETITSVVCLKKHIMCDYMKSFLKAYKRLAPQMRLQDSQGLGELRRFVFEQEDFKEVRMSTAAYLSYDERRLGEKAANVALLMVQDGTVSNLAYSIRDVINAGKINDDELKRSSMDDLKIQSIGVIAQFSTLAVEFGFSGMADAFDSGRKVDEAKVAAARFERQKEMIDINNTKVNAIDQYANIHLKLLNRFAPLMEEYVARSVQIISSKDNIFRLGRIKERKFTQNELEVLAFTFSLVGAVKAVIDSPIISQSGEVFDGNKSNFDMAQNCIGTFERKCLEMRA